jgi:hypothetical protein
MALVVEQAFDRMSIFRKDPNQMLDLFSITRRNVKTATGRSFLPGRTMVRQAAGSA